MHVLRYTWDQWYIPMFFPYYKLKTHVTSCTSVWKRINSFMTMEVVIRSTSVTKGLHSLHSLCCPTCANCTTIFWANKVLYAPQPMQFLLLKEVFLLSTTEKAIVIVEDLTQILHTSVKAYVIPGRMIYSFLYVHITTVVNRSHLDHLFGSVFHTKLWASS